MENEPIMDENELQSLYQWVDEIALSRPKRNIARDFSDGVLVAEVCKHFFPKLVDLHNYSGAQSVSQKMYNWTTLDAKVFKKLNFQITKKDMQDVCTCVPGAIERVLANLRLKIQQVETKRAIASQQRAEAPRQTASRPPPGFEDDVPAPRRGGGGHGGGHGGVPIEIIQEKDETINEMRETINILELKIRKLEQLVKIKDHKIQALQGRLAQQQQYLGEQ
eukprot:NODE_1203_length_957_cov_78.695181_g1158_i0.p1 GENE.NODE_1203_length_957_cov_78.695181_g1158_i0~~NODE_1203_length_957_cov_78.695181_g1158_i0.p1  ORF type:complete len:221 (+),score=40.66 NODE_1203_length_957_cov_78.695181_g1158_i0:171-833(+)